MRLGKEAPFRAKTAIIAPMPQRYFFHLVNCIDEITDFVGVDADTADQAHAEAVAVIFEMKDDGDLPSDLSDWNLEIRTGNGELVRLIRLG